MDRRRLVYTVRFVIAAWLAIAGLYGIIKGIYYLSGNNATATIIAGQVVFYSGTFAFMGWQMYKRWVDGIGGEVATRGDDQKVKSATNGKNKKTGGNYKSLNNQTSAEEMNTLAYRLQEGNTQSHLSEVLDLSIAFRRPSAPATHDRPFSAEKQRRRQ